MTATALISHPAAEAFPLLDGDEFVALRDDIATNGLRLPLVLTPDGLLLDGRNRLRACNELGIEPPTVVHDGDPVSYVVSINIARRHMNESQRALVAARLATMRQGERTDLASIDARLIAQPAAAAMLNVSRPSVQRAAAVLRGVEAGDIPAEAVQDIERGRATVSGVLAAHRPAEPPAFVPEPASNDSIADDNWYDEPLTPFEERVAASYVPPVAPAPATADHQRINLSTNNEWYTPAQFVEAARQVMGRIDLDPASCEYANRTVRAEQIYTIDDDGMSQPWTGRVWMNPPYGREEGESDSNQARWTRRLIDEYQAGNVTEAVILVNAVPGNRWFAPLKNFPICFPDARIRFYNEQTEAGQPTHSNALVYLGPDVARFVAVFSQFGRVMAPLAVDGDGYRVDL